MYAYITISHVLGMDHFMFGGGLSVKLGRERELSPLWTLVLAMSEPCTVQFPVQFSLTTI